MSDAYANVLGGGLKLKGGGIKKKKKSRPKDDGALVEASSSAATSAAPPDGASRSTTSSGANFTATEQRRMETMHKRKEDLAKKGKLAWPTLDRIAGPNPRQSERLAALVPTGSLRRRRSTRARSVERIIGSCLLVRAFSVHLFLFTGCFLFLGRIEIRCRPSTRT